MSKNLDEQMSAFLDGELPVEELDLFLAQLDRDPDRRARLARYSLIGEQMRTGTSVPASAGVAERVRTALLAEEAIQPKPRRFTPVPTGWMAGAVAATVALAAVLVAEPFSWQADPALNLESQAQEMPVAFAGESIEPVLPSATRRLNPDAAARLTGYLVAHGAYTNSLSRSNFDSRVVFARAERASWSQPRGTADAQ